MRHIIYLALGSNMGSRLENLTAATAHMPPAVQPLAVSPVYETAPWGFTDQPDFLNQVVKAQTDLPPYSLLAHIRHLESLLGRQPTFRYGPRLIDIDILFFDDLVFQKDELKIPHERLAERAFVLVPLADLAPDLVHPQLGKSVRQLLEAVDSSEVRPYPNQ